jgi:XapX domain-containing protein
MDRKRSRCKIHKQLSRYGNNAEPTISSSLFSIIRSIDNMTEILLSLLAGLILGLVFFFIKLPLPAPPVLPGVMGIVGIWLAGVIGPYIVEFFTK